MILADCCGRAQLEYGLPPRFGGRHACAQILFDLESEMFDHLFSQALVRAASGCKIRQADEEASYEFHPRSSAFTLKKRTMIAAVCSQSRASACSCLRPAAVSR